MADYVKQLKRITLRDGAVIGLNVVVEDSLPVLYSLSHERKRLITFKSRAAAYRMLSHVEAEGLIALRQDSHPDLVSAEVERIERCPMLPVDRLRFHVLVELVASKLNTSNRMNLSRLKAFADGEVPTGEKEFVEWLESLLVNLQELARTERTLQKGLSGIKRVFRSLQEMPIAFRRYLHLAPIVEGRVRAVKHAQRGKRIPISNYKCLTKGELDLSFRACSSFPQVCLLVCYLCMGFRSGEAERVTEQSVDSAGMVNFGTIVRKTKVSRRTHAPLCFKVVVRFQMEELPSTLSPFKARYRATAATLLSLAGLPPILVSERLNHADTTMVIRHYAKTPPSDLNGLPLDQYLAFGGISLDSVPIEGNTWDLFLLSQLLLAAQRYSLLSDVKDSVRAILRCAEHKVELKQIEF